MSARPVKDSDFLKRARDRFKLANEADTEQAQRERDDIAFEDGDQWPADVRLARMGQQPNAGLPAVPARPTLVINQVQEPVRQVLNQERQADIGVELVPADDFGDLGVTPDDTEITLREGLVRRIQRESIAADARTWAFKRAVIAGRGYYLVMTRYLPGKTWDQEIYLHRIYNQAGVLLDPSHEQPDGSDADWGFVGTWVPWDRISKEYPTLADGKPSPFSDYTEEDFIGMTEQYPDWFRQGYEVVDTDGKKASIPHVAVRVTDYWYVDRESRRLALLEDGSAVWEEELPAGVTAVETRTVVEKTIRFCKIVGGVAEVEQTDWAGPDMPIVKVLGDEVLPYDNQRRARGMVRSARGPQEGSNYMVSKFVESVGLSPIPRDRIDPDAIDGYEAWWMASNVRTLPYLPYRTYDDNGREFRPPTPNNGDPNILPIAQAIAMFKEFVQTTTGGAAPNRLGTNQRVQADRAIRRLQEEEQFNTSNFLDNLARSIRYEGQIINNLLYPIYGAKPGRLVRVLTGEGDNQTYVIQDPQQQQQQMQMRQLAEKVGKLTKDAHFNVLVKVAKSTESRRGQFIEMFGDIISADPGQMAVAGDLFYKNLDIPEAKQLAERMRVMLAPPVQQMLAAKDSGQPFDPAAQAQLAQLSERLQMAEQIMQQQQQAIETKVVENQAKVQIAQMDGQVKLQLADLEAKRDALLAQQQAQADLEKARMDNAAKIHIAEIAAKTKGVIQAQEMEHEAIALAHTQQHESEQRALDDENLERQQAHEVAMAGVEGDRAADESERGRQATAAENDANRQAAREQPEAGA